jgi:hypothetical protein
MPNSPQAAQSAAAAADGRNGQPFGDDDHEAMKKQWQTNLEIDLLKSAWIRKDREQQAQMLSAGK